jgi:hypothetical protein
MAVHVCGTMTNYAFDKYVLRDPKAMDKAGAEGMQ